MPSVERFLARTHIAYFTMEMAVQPEMHTYAGEHAEPAGIGLHFRPDRHLHREVCDVVRARTGSIDGIGATPFYRGADNREPVSSLFVHSKPGDNSHGGAVRVGLDAPRGVHLVSHQLICQLSGAPSLGSQRGSAIRKYALSEFA